MSTTRGKQKDIKEPKGFVCFFGEKEPVTWERETYRYVYKVRRLKRENDSWLANNKIFDEKMDKEEIFLLKNNTYEVLSYSDETPQTTPINQQENTYTDNNSNQKQNKNIHNDKVEYKEVKTKSGNSDNNLFLYIIDNPGEKSEQPFQVHFTYNEERVEKNIVPMKKKKRRNQSRRSNAANDQLFQLQFTL